MFYGQHTSVFRVLFCVVLFVATERILAADSPSVTGLWKNEDASFEVYEENGKLNAKIVSLREPLAPDGEQKTDIHNPDAGKHSRPILGMIFMTGFTPAGSGKWENDNLRSEERKNVFLQYGTGRHEHPQSTRLYWYFADRKNRNLEKSELINSR